MADTGDTNSMAGDDDKVGGAAGESNSADTTAGDNNGSTGNMTGSANNASNAADNSKHAAFTSAQPIPGAKIEVAYARTMWELTGKFRGEEAIDDALYDCLEILVKAVGCEAGVIWLKSAGEDGCLYALHSIGAIAASGVPVKPGPEGGFVGDVFASEKYAFVNYCKADARWSHETDDALCFDTRSTICTVITIDTGAVGCVQLFNKDEGFTDEDYDITELFGLLAGMTMPEKGFEIGDMTPTADIINLRKICKEFTNGDTVTRILKGVDLDFFKGEFAVILGESGCGKSTLLNVIGGMDASTSGNYTFEGTSYSDASEGELTEFRRNNIGFIFQSYNLMPNLTARENLDFIAELREGSADSGKMLELVKLGDRENNYPSEMSGGQQQRVSIARALVKNPSLILADEPTAALDYATSIEVLTLFENICLQGVTLIVVTHNEEITKMADRVIRLKDGVVYSTRANRNPSHAADLVW